MKNHLIISLLFLSVGFCQQEYDINQIVERNDVYVKKFSDEIVNEGSITKVRLPLWLYRKTFN